MIRDITVGQFYPADSVIHKLDPRTKIICTLIYIIAIFFVNKLQVYLIIVLMLAVVVYLSKVPPKFMFKGLKNIVIIISFTGILNLFLTPGENVLFKMFFLTVTSEGVYMTVMMALRLVLLIVGSSILTLTTTPMSLTDGIEFLLKPLKKIGVPSGEIAMMMTIALRFIPILLEETDKIMKAQMSRGADFYSGGIIKKAKALIPLLVPLFLSAFRRAEELSVAMESRCYNSGKIRTRMKQMIYSHMDFKAYGFMALFLIILITLNKNIF